MTTAKVMDVIARFPGCDGQAADAVSSHTQVKLEDAPNCSKIPNQNVRCLYTFSTTQMAKSMKIEDPVALYDKICAVIPLSNYFGTNNSSKLLPELGWEKISELGVYVCSS